MKKVAIFGGGVAGLSAAHELMERGFDVNVFEAKDIAGGKARSINKPNSGKNGKKDLPGEHGFRFFPGFYRHITDTMSRIPFEQGVVTDNLVKATQIMHAFNNHFEVTSSITVPISYSELKNYLKVLLGEQLPLSIDELDYGALRIWQFLTSCEERRITEYETISWWDYIGAEYMSANYKMIFGESVRTLVAAKPKQMSALTGLKIFQKIFFDSLTPGHFADRVLNGPTNEVWINPWLSYLRNMGVEYNFSSKVEEIILKDGIIDRVKINSKRKTKHIIADYYIFALPVEVMNKLLNKDILAADPSLNGIRKLSKHVSWMNGLQLFLRVKLPLVNGHVMYNGSPWALTSISQGQFWSKYDLSKYGDGTIKDILSVDISEWDTKGVLYGKTAKECTRKEIKNEVWAQLKMSLNDSGLEIIKDEFLGDWFMDPDIRKDGESPEVYRNKNAEPLLVNRVNSWHLRPNVYTKIPNMFLASDYVKTNTDLATMEAANEAARRAVNCIIEKANLNANYCKIWKLQDPIALKYFRRQDRKRFEKGLPWSGALPLKLTTLQRLFKFK